MLVVNAVYGSTETVIPSFSRVRLSVEAGTFRIAGGDRKERSLTAADATANTLTSTSHGYRTGEGPYLLSGSTLPAPLNTTTKYWVARVDADKIKLALSQQQALDGDTIDLTTAGTPASWKIGGVPAAPTASVTDGLGSFKLATTDQAVELVAPGEFTVKGASGTDILIYIAL